MGQQPEIFRISRGIASYKLSDHYAVLGIALTADANQIRKKYLRLAKSLHPDVYGRNPSEKELASKFLAKMVNPAYQVLNTDRERGEYFATLRLFAQGLKQKAEQIQPQSEIAKKLLRFPHENNYMQAVSEIATRQYESLDNILEITADLSELNLVYLFTQEALSIPTAAPAVRKDAPDASAPVAKPASPALRNLQLVEVFIGKKQWTEALRELKAAEKLDPNSGKVYALQGLVYMNQGVAVMAKTSFQKALKLDPKEPIALKYINLVSQPSSSSATSKQPPKKEEKKGGLFGWGKK